jgi:hypothetical protein
MKKNSAKIALFIGKLREDKGEKGYYFKERK